MSNSTTEAGTAPARRFLPSLAPETRRHVVGLAAAIGFLHVLGFAILFGLVIPQHFTLATGGVFGLSLGLTAYTLGMRHAFDADHIAAIDNVTRKLIGEGRESLSVGFFFSLGHSTIVVALGLLVAAGVGGLGETLQNDNSLLHQVTGVWGPVVAGSFLLLFGALNAVVLANVVKVFRRTRRGDFDEAEMERQLAMSGTMHRFYTRATRSVTKPWHMYPVGVLFGFGFDTATEIALLLLAGGAAASGMPFYAVMCLPILFAAGMTLFDTVSNVFMNTAYGSAMAHPIRRILLNLTVTSVSVFAAFAIGTLSLLSVAIDELKLSGAAWRFVSEIDLTYVGYVTVAAFATIWATSLAIWRTADTKSS